MHSAQAQSVRVKEKIYFGFVGHHCRDNYKKLGYMYILSSFPSQALRFEL